jgi:hypothetical protein
MDKELLEMAAKAAGMKVTSYPDGVWRNTTGFHPLMNVYAAPKWNPLTDDGDALRLAVKLQLEIDICLTGVSGKTPTGVKALVDSREESDAYAATRRAIVRAAAEIGRAK